MNWKKVKLGAIVSELESGSRPKGGSLSAGVASIGGTQISENGGFKWDTIHYVPESYFSSLKSGIIQQNDLLVVKDGATTGKVAIVDETFPYDKASINEHVFRLKIDQNKALPKFVFFYLFTETGQREILKDFRGATVGGISRNFVEKSTIPLPDLITQQKIVAVLDKSQNLIQKRKQSIQVLDDLLNSTFLEMFGDPVLNTNNWKKKKIKDLADVLTGYAFKSEFYSKNPDDVKICGGLIIYPDFIDWQKANHWSVDEADTLSKFHLETDDIVIALDRPWISSGFKMAKIRASDPKSILIQRTARVRGLRISSNYLYSVFNHKAFELHCRPTETTIPHISPKEIQEFEIPVPPQNLQDNFDVVSSKIAKKKELLKKQNNKLENLFQSLLQDAFSGKLNFNDDLPLDVILDQYLMGDTTKLEKKQNRELLNTLSKSTSKLDEFKKRIEQQQFGSLEEYETGKAILFELLQFSTPAIEQEYYRRTKKVSLK